MQLFLLLQLFVSSAAVPLDTTSIQVTTSVESSNSTSELPVTESSGQGTTDPVYPTTVNTQTDAPITAVVNESESPSQDQSTTTEVSPTFQTIAKLASITAVFPTKTESSPTTKDSSTAEDAATTDSSMLILPLTVPFTQKPSTTTNPQPSMGSVVYLSIAKSPSVTEHQTSAILGLKPSTSHLLPTSVKYASLTAIVSSGSSESESLSVSKPQSITQEDMTITTEFPDFTTVSKNADFDSPTIAKHPITTSFKIQPTSTVSKTTIKSTTLSLMNSATVMSSMDSKPEPSSSLEGLHVVESPSVTADQPPIVHSFSATTKSMLKVGYETISPSVSTMEPMVMVESTSTPQVPLETLQYHNMTELLTIRKISTTEFLIVATSSTASDNYPITTNHHPIFGESSAPAEYLITRVFSSATQYPTQVLTTTNFMSLDLQLTTTNEALHTSFVPTTTELSTATKSLMATNQHSPASLLSTEILIIPSQTVLEFAAVSIDPPLATMKSPLLTLSPTTVDTMISLTGYEPATKYTASTETPKKSTSRVDLLTSPHATLLPTSIKPEPQIQSMNKSFKVTVNPSELQYPTTTQLLSSMISPTPALTKTVSDTKSPSNVVLIKPRLITKSLVSSDFLVTNTMAPITIESLHIIRSSESPPFIEHPTTESLITIDQSHKALATTLSTMTPSATTIDTGPLNATVITTKVSASVSGSSRVSLFITTSLESPSTTAFETLPTALSPSTNDSIPPTTIAEKPLISITDLKFNTAESVLKSATIEISPVVTLALRETSIGSLALQTSVEAPSTSELPMGSSTAIELSPTATRQSITEPTAAVSASRNYQTITPSNSTSVPAAATLSTTTESKSLTSSTSLLPADTPLSGMLSQENTVTMEPPVGLTIIPSAVSPSDSATTSMLVMPSIATTLVQPNNDLTTPQNITVTSQRSTVVVKPSLVPTKLKNEIEFPTTTGPRITPTPLSNVRFSSTTILGELKPLTFTSLKSSTNTESLFPADTPASSTSSQANTVTAEPPVVSRRCDTGGVWQTFNESDCGVVNEQLNRLNNSFNNVSHAVL